MKKIHLNNYTININSIIFYCNDGCTIISVPIKGYENKLTRSEWLDNSTIQLFNNRSIEVILDILEKYVGFAEDNNKIGG